MVRIRGEGGEGGGDSPRDWDDGRVRGRPQAPPAVRVCHHVGKKHHTGGVFGTGALPCWMDDGQGDGVLEACRKHTAATSMWGKDMFRGYEYGRGKDMVRGRDASPFMWYTAKQRDAHGHASDAYRR